MTTPEDSESFELGSITFAVRAGGRTTVRTAPKTWAYLTYDIGWLLGGPAQASQANRVLQKLPGADAEVVPIDYGLLVVDFDRKTITSLQQFCPVGYVDEAVVIRPEIALAPAGFKMDAALQLSLSLGALSRISLDNRDYPFVLPVEFTYTDPLARMAQLREMLRGKELRGRTVIGLQFDRPAWAVREFHPVGSSELGAEKVKHVFSLLAAEGFKVGELATWEGFAAQY